VNSQYSLQAFNEYILYERRAKHPDLFVTRGIYERAIAEAAKQRFNGQSNVEDILRIFWAGYCDSLVRHFYLSFVCFQTRFQRLLNAGPDIELETFHRAVRSVPGSGEVWARYIRFLVCRYCLPVVTSS
jgi:hypothetical protein